MRLDAAVPGETLSCWARGEYHRIGNLLIPAFPPTGGAYHCPLARGPTPPPCCRSHQSRLLGKNPGATALLSAWSEQRSHQRSCSHALAHPCPLWSSLCSFAVPLGTCAAACPRWTACARARREWMEGGFPLSPAASRGLVVKPRCLARALTTHSIVACERAIPGVCTAAGRMGAPLPTCEPRWVLGSNCNGARPNMITVARPRQSVCQQTGCIVGCRKRPFKRLSSWRGQTSCALAFSLVPSVVHEPRKQVTCTGVPKIWGAWWCLCQQSRAPQASAGGADIS